MTGRLEGKVAFITGAARGQGRAHALRMAEEGADVIAVDITGKLPDCVRYDSARSEDLDETVRLVEVAELGRLDVIVANAGIASPQTRDEITPESFRDVMDANVTGTWNAVMSGARHIVDGGRGGSVILVSSAAGLKMQPFMIHYTTSKHAVTGMARGFAAELGKHGVRVNSVHPGPAATDMGSGDMVAEIGRTLESNPQLANMLVGFLPAGICDPRDIADAVLWLASDESKFVTATAIAVDGGTTQY